MTGPYSVVTVTDGLTLNGSIDLGLAVYTVFNQFASLDFQGAQTLSGAGSIVFGGNPANQINTASSGGDSGTLTIGLRNHHPRQLRHDRLQRRWNPDPFINQGLSMPMSAAAISIYGAGWTNSGTLEAENGGTLSLNGTWTDSGPVTANRLVGNPRRHLQPRFRLLLWRYRQLDLTGTLNGTGSTLTVDGVRADFCSSRRDDQWCTVDLTSGATLVGPLVRRHSRWHHAGRHARHDRLLSHRHR